MSVSSSVGQLHLPKVLPDHASEEDSRGLAIDKVGVQGLSYPIQVMDRTHRVQHTVADVSLFVGLPKEYKGTHMSRFIEVLNSFRGELTFRNMPAMLTEVRRRLKAEDAYATVSFPYFISKRAPVSGVESLMEYRCSFKASMGRDDQDLVLSVEVPVKTLCPCSKAVSERGAHNQRSVVGVSIRSTEFLWIEDVVEAIEGCASSPLYALLKREDEKYVTEHAYDNPKFVEDLVRDVVLATKALPGVVWLGVHAANQESIHNHQAYAQLEWSLEQELAERQFNLDLKGPADPAPAGFTFGEWLRQTRKARNYSQQEMAESLGISASHLSRVESGDKSLSSTHLTELAAVLGLDAVHVHLRAGVLTPELSRLIATDPERFLGWARAALGHGRSGENN